MNLPLHLHPFPLLCAGLCVSTGRLKTVYHKGDVAVILAKTEHLRCLQTALGLMAGHAPFWVPRRLGDRKTFRFEQQQRNRSDRTLRRPCWRGEPRPQDAVTVAPQSAYLSHEELVELMKLGYPLSAACAAVPRSHMRAVPPDRRKAGCHDVDEQKAGATGYTVLQDPEHVYMPDSSGRRTTVGGGFSRVQVERGLKKMRVNKPAKNALFDIVYKRASTKRTAAKYRLPAEHLYLYATRLRGYIRRAR